MNTEEKQGQFSFHVDFGKNKKKIKIKKRPLLRSTVEFSGGLKVQLPE